ncbi:hypothetical protein [Paludibacterium yongneupense]|uniref:hypothetical protein n=1 Tax=Paludibacterium yongneupense TaxID=400061 RepID=UPI00041CE1D0|nr:hypothetical protein [Paludibacterium yongneupense]
MHTIAVIGAGLLLLGLFVRYGWRRGGRAAAALAARVFIPAWLLPAMANMWVGVSRAGYGVRDEFPILLIVFAVPALAAVVTARRLARR